jgi:hypothetical protein
LPNPDFVFQRKEGGVNEGWNSQHDGGTEGCTRRRVALMKGGMMTALGNTARGSTVGRQRQGAAQRRAARRRQQQQGAAWQDDKNNGWHGSEGQYICHKGSTDGGTRRTAAALLTVDFVGCANGISGGIKEVGGALPLSPRNRHSHDGCPGIFIALLSLYGARIFNDGSAYDN